MMMKYILQLLAYWTPAISINMQHNQAIAESVTATATKYIEKQPCTRLNIADPEIYEGDPKKLEPWITAMNMYFDFNGETDEQTRIIYALSKIKGGKGDIATNWADVLRKAIMAFPDRTLLSDVLT